MSGVRGIGWVSGNRYGAERRGLGGEFSDPFKLRDELLECGILPYAIKRFAKSDDTCRMTHLIAALALYDAAIQCGPQHPNDIAVLGTNENGCLETNRRFYQDFVDHGRKRGRGSLFVYTLPSMPAAEVSMHFKLLGPSAWIASTEPSSRPLLERGNSMLRRGEREAVLALNVDGTGGVGFLLTAAEDDCLTDLSTALTWAERHPASSELIEALRASLSRTDAR